MSEHNHDISGHDYDGITELDHLLPRWWLWLFWLCTFFAAGYLLYYHVLFPNKTSSAEYVREVAEGEAIKEAAVLAAGINFDIPDKDRFVTRGKDVFARNCVMCHGPAAQGLVGPNLTDDHWIHGGQFAQIRKTIAEGVPAKAMPTWKLQLSPVDIYSVASFIWSIHGSNPPNARPPEGSKEPHVEPSAAAAAAPAGAPAATPAAAPATAPSTAKP